MVAEKTETPHDRRLSTWKEIATFFGCDERTVKRWETTRGLPVHRVPNGIRSPVFAYESELRAWLNSHEEAEEPRAGESASGHPVFRLGGPASIVLGALAIAVLALGIWEARQSGPVRSEAPASAHHPNAEAQAFYRAGLFEWQSRTPSGLRHAVDDFTQAIVRDPQYAQAYAGLAQCYELLREYTTVTPDYAFPRAKAAADRAIALDPTLADAHLALAFVDFYWSHDAATARREFQRAVALAPGSAVAHHWYATFLVEMAEYRGAIAEIDRAAALDTESIAIQADKGLILFYAGRHAESVALLQRLESTQPSFASTHRYLARAYLAENDERGFLRELSLAAQATEDADEKETVSAGERGLTASGRTGMLRAMLHMEEPLVRDGKGSAYALATMHAELGDTGAAVIWLRQSLARGESEITGLAIEPSFRRLRELPEFRRLEQEAGVGPRA
jgi:Tfp pilus assembly protein PilF